MAQYMVLEIIDNSSAPSDYIDDHFDEDFNSAQEYYIKTCNNKEEKKKVYLCTILYSFET